MNDTMKLTEYHENGTNGREAENATYACCY
jgi:hypothetical protein